MSSKLQSKEGENACLKKENEQLQKEMKNEVLSMSSIENKLKKASEECEKYKACFKNAKQEEKVLEFTNFSHCNIQCLSLFVGS